MPSKVQETKTNVYMCVVKEHSLLSQLLLALTGTQNEILEYQK